MNKDQITGTAKDIAGKAQRKIGEATGSIEQHTVRGSHDNILQEPRVRELARLVADAIARSGSVRVSRA